MKSQEKMKMMNVKSLLKPLTFKELQLLEKRLSHIPEAARAIESELGRRQGKA